MEIAQSPYQYSLKCEDESNRLNKLIYITIELHKTSSVVKTKEKDIMDKSSSISKTNKESERCISDATAKITATEKDAGCLVMLVSFGIAYILGIPILKKLDPQGWPIGCFWVGVFGGVVVCGAIKYLLKKNRESTNDELFNTIAKHREIINQNDTSVKSIVNEQSSAKNKLDDLLKEFRVVADTF